MRNMNNEQGRSMIEMLGVLAIVGVLSVAGIQGYSKAMGKYKINQVMDEVSTIAANVKTLFASQGQYTDLDNTSAGTTASDVAVQLGLIPDNMTRTAQVLNAMNGTTLVSKTGDGKGFFIVMNGLTDEGCIALGTSDWGSSAGYKGVTLSNAVATMPTANLGATTHTVTPTTAADAKFTAVTAEGICDCSTATCSATFEFY